MPGTSREPGRYRLRNWSAGCTNYRRASAWSPTAAAPIAYSPTKPWRCCGRAAGQPFVWKSAIRTGGRKDYRWLMREISAGTLREWLEEGREVTVVDVRPAEDRAQWSIPGSVHVDAYAALKSGDPDALDALRLLPGVPVVTVCNAGVVSRIATELLAARGVDAVSLAGGMKAWSLAWNTAEVPMAGGVAVVQVRRTGKGCLSYLIGSDGEAAVVDAALDPGVYLGIARERGWSIRYAIDTHIHADHISRSRLLAQTCGAELALPEQDRVHFDFRPLRDGDTIRVGTTALEALSTPGHTRESLCYRLTDAAIFTGDTLFVAGVGRPDLHADRSEAAARAELLFSSLSRLRALPPRMLALPAHAAQPIPFDRRAVCATLEDAFGRVEDWLADRERFVRTVLERIPRAARELRADRRDERKRRADRRRCGGAGSRRQSLRGHVGDLWRWAAGRPTGFAPELAAIFAAGSDQRLCRRHGGERARGAAPAGRARVRNRIAGGDSFFHRQLRRGEGAREPRRRPVERPHRPEEGADCGLGNRAATARDYFRRAELGLGGRGERPARHQSGTVLVDDGAHEDRPGGAPPSWIRARFERGRRLWGRLAGRSVLRVCRVSVRVARGSVLYRRDARCARTSGVGSLRSRHAAACRAWNRRLMSQRARRNSGGHCSPRARRAWSII